MALLFRTLRGKRRNTFLFWRDLTCWQLARRNGSLCFESKNTRYGVKPAARAPNDKRVQLADNLLKRVQTAFDCRERVKWYIDGKKAPFYGCLSACRKSPVEAGLLAVPPALPVDIYLPTISILSSRKK